MTGLGVDLLYPDIMAGLPAALGLREPGPTLGNEQKSGSPAQSDTAGSM